MRKFLLPITLLGLLFVAVHATPAQAQATRTWVSGVGDDANPCSRTAPCKTFAGAISKTAAGGEINCLDSGGFGGLSINKSLTVRCVALEAGVLVAGTNGITVTAAATDTVTLDGLDIEGLSPPNASPNGVIINSGKEVYILNSRIHQFSQNGVLLQSSTSGGRVIINNSIIHNTGVGGVNVTGPNNVATITNSQINAAGTFGVQANGAGTIVGIAYSTLNVSPTAVSAINGGQVISVGPSNVVSGAGTFSSTTPLR
ncbi:MAG: hypothetical protein QOF19_2901 [Alphaproteobacteria bacterium]|nr:hypothetical protein [Alphaproteobacteria bacterium]